MTWGASFRDECAKRAAFVAAPSGPRVRIGGGAQNVGVATPPRPSNLGAVASAHAVRRAVARPKPPLPVVSGVR